MAAAKTSQEGTWTCWIAIVLGNDEALDRSYVVTHGEKLDEAVARAIFPRFRSFPYENGQKLKDSWLLTCKCPRCDGTCERPAIASFNRVTMCRDCRRGVHWEEKKK